MNAYAHHPDVSARVATPFFEDYLAHCDDPDAFTVIDRNERITTIEAPPDALIELWADAMRYSHPDTAPTGTDAHVIASAERTQSLLVSDVGDLRHEARMAAKRAVAACPGL